MAGSPMVKVNQLITVATWTAAVVVPLAVMLPVTLPGAVVITVLLSAIRGNTVAIYVFSCFGFDAPLKFVP